MLTMPLDDVARPGPYNGQETDVRWADNDV